MVAPAEVRWAAQARKRVSTASRSGADGKVPAGMDSRLSITSIKRSIQGAASSSPSLPFLLSAPQEPRRFNKPDCDFAIFPYKGTQRASVGHLIHLTASKARSDAFCVTPSHSVVQEPLTPNVGLHVTVLDVQVCISEGYWPTKKTCCYLMQSKDKTLWQPRQDHQPQH